MIQLKMCLDTGKNKCKLCDTVSIKIKMYCTVAHSAKFFCIAVDVGSVSVTFCIVRAAEPCWEYSVACGKMSCCDNVNGLPRY